MDYTYINPLITARLALKGLTARAYHDMAMKSGQYTRNVALHARQGNAGEVYPVAQSHLYGSGSSELCLVEARGVEPLSEDRQCTVSTCVADNLSFAAIHARRQA